MGFITCYPVYSGFNRCHDGGVSGLDDGWAAGGVSPYPLRLYPHLFNGLFTVEFNGKLPVAEGEISETKHRYAVMGALKRAAVALLARFV